MVKTKNLLKTLSACAVVLALGGCGGSDDDGSIVACFTADRTVNFAISGSLTTNRSTTGPMTYNNQPVTGQIFFYSTGAKSINYWTVTSSGVTNIASIDYNNNVTRDDSFYPQNMKPGQRITNSDKTVITTFVGFETINLSGKTFSNSCHISQNFNGGTYEIWIASGYGLIKQIAPSGAAEQYNGDI